LCNFSPYKSKCQNKHVTYFDFLACFGCHDVSYKLFFKASNQRYRNNDGLVESSPERLKLPQLTDGGSKRRKQDCSSYRKKLDYFSLQSYKESKPFFERAA
jgi:hypothetical protein